ncbi:MAG: hypothetical protein ACXW2E_00275 [Nitrososphaeraceae archaeon]
MNKTILSDRTLWFDGYSSYNCHQLEYIISKKYPICYVDEMTDEIDQFNKLMPVEKRLTVKTSCNQLKYDWNLPEYYKQLNVYEYVYEKHIELTMGMDADEIYNRDVRLTLELKKYIEFNMIDILRTMIYIINTLIDEGVVWGVGRGSSVSSYVLYVIGLHDIDSFKHDLDIADFFHD